MAITWYGTTGYGTSFYDYYNYYGSLALTIYGYGGNDWLGGNTNNDRLYGGDGNDSLYGYGGNDTLNGGTGNDTLGGGTGNDWLYGDTGNDYLGGDSGNDVLYGGTGNDTLDGGMDNDWLYGDSGTDKLMGGSGNDYLQGSSSTWSNSYEYDTLTGGAGADTFALGTWWGNSYVGAGYATITDFSWSSGDKIQVKGYSSQYQLKSENWGGTSALDTAIYSRSTNDLIGVVQDTTNVLLSYDFKFV